MPVPIRAILFDLGGVVVEYKDPKKYSEFIKIATSIPELLQRLEDFECGRISMADVEEEYLHLFGMSHKDDMEQSWAKNMGRRNPFVARAIHSLRASGKYSLGLLTNNGFLDAQRTKSTLVDPGPHFNHVIESCKIGQRKPNAAFYQIALDKMGGLSADECVFIDDLRANCIGAESLGIHSIWLEDGVGQTAMEQLEELLGEELL